MAAVRARRSGRHSGGEPPRRRRGAPPPSMGAMPRLAQIKLNGGLSGDDVKVSGRSLVLALTGAVLFLGVSAAGATWLGGSLFDTREAFAAAADSSVATAGFAIAEVDVSAMRDSPVITDARLQEVRALVVPKGRHSILSLDPEEVRARVQSLDWVADARVQRLWPSTLRVEVRRRQEYALWEEQGETSVIDANGERLLAERVSDHPNLPRVSGRGAGPAAEPILMALESLPELRERVTRLERIGDRRWDVLLTSGAVIALPELDAPEALARLETLHSEYALLDRPVTELDLRAPGRLAVRIHPELEGGPSVLLGGV
ncbi:MAG: cell division protein FtsQ/DivIB [Hyphomonadaceae bacterium]